MKNKYMLPDGYVSRETPTYFQDFEHSLYQWSVYQAAVSVARLANAKRIVDLGSGAAWKLDLIFRGYACVGVDTGSNLEFAKKEYPSITFYSCDFETELFQQGLWPSDLFQDAVVICADVIEHLVNPERLLHTLRAAFGKCPTIISTPDRERLRGVTSLGPPSNESHVREWSREEFRKLLTVYGLNKWAFEGWCAAVPTASTNTTSLFISGDLTAAQVFEVQNEAGLERAPDSMQVICNTQGGEVS